MWRVITLIGREVLLKKTRILPGRSKEPLAQHLQNEHIVDNRVCVL